MIYANLAHYGIYGTYKPITLSTNDIAVLKTKISIEYGNYANIFLSISSNENLKQPVLSVYDLLGRKIKMIGVTVGYNKIDISYFPKGMYFFKVEEEGKILGQGKVMNFSQY